MPKITPCLWFNTEAEQAARFYTSIFKNSKIGRITHYGDAGPRRKGEVLTVDFELDGQEFQALNGGPEFKFTEAVSFTVHCKDQDEVDEFWQKLSAGGQENVCGWLKDRYGLSWQIVPNVLPKMLSDPDQERADRVMEAVMRMKKLDIEELERAYDLEGARQ